MPNSEILMDYAAVSQAAGKIDTAGQEFNTLIAPLAEIGQILAEQAFVGATGNAASHALAEIQMQVQFLVRRCQEMSVDIRTSIQNFQTGDNESAEQFK